SRRRRFFRAGRPPNRRSASSRSAASPLVVWGRARRQGSRDHAARVRCPVAAGLHLGTRGALRGRVAVCYRPRVMGDNVTLVRDGALATVTLNRPDRRNSLSDAMLTELGAAFGELRDDAATRVVIVTGAPPVFSAGADAPLS